MIFGNTLVLKKERWKKKDNSEDDWITKDKKIIFDEINIVCRGTSLKKYLKKINKNLPTFFINFSDDPYSRGLGENKKTPYLELLKIFFKRSNFYGFTSGGFSNSFSDFQIDNFSKGLYPSIIFRLGVPSKEQNNKILWTPKKRAYPDVNYLKKIDNYLPKNLRGTYKLYKKIKFKINKKNERIVKLISKNAIIHFKYFIHEKYFGSALGAIFLLGKSSKRVNIYGWDHYLKKNIDKYNYWELIYAISNKSMNLYGTGPYGDRCKLYFSEAIWNLLYAAQLSIQKKYKIFSRLTKIRKQERLLKNIEKIIFIF